MSYKGKISTSGTSEAILLEKDLFIQHPEFKQEAAVKADIIGQGTMLISIADKSNIENDSDPIVSAFLSFLEKDMSENAAVITAVDAKTISRTKALTSEITGTEDELD